jgi:hypothetical protein
LPECGLDYEVVGRRSGVDHRSPEDLLVEFKFHVFLLVDFRREGRPGLAELTGMGPTYGRLVVPLLFEPVAEAGEIRRIVEAGPQERCDLVAEPRPVDTQDGMWNGLFREYLS